MNKLSTFLIKIPQITAVLLALKIFALSGTALQAAAPEETIKIGFVVLLSGSAAGSFGTPAYNSAKLAIDVINNGKLPAPYNSKGLNGKKIEAVFIDENSKSTVSDYKSLIRKHKVDFVVGYISSQHCKEVAPVAEAMKQLTILFDCGTPQIFEDIVTRPKYLFRTAAHASMDSITAARYLIDTSNVSVSYAGINQNYSWGHDSWSTFSKAMVSLAPKSKKVDQHFPNIYIGEYGSEISTLLKSRPKVIHTSFWGGDLEAFLVQATARGLFSKSTVILTTGESAMHRLADQIPENAIIGAKGTHGGLAPDIKLNRWFKREYFNRYGKIPTYPSYKMIQSILAIKAAYSKVGKTTANTSEVISALRGLTYMTPSGVVKMALSNGHQAVHDIAYGTYKFDQKTGMPSLRNIRRYSADCISPPEGVKSKDWIKSGFKGANCTSTAKDL